MSVTEYDDLQLRIDRDADGSYRVLAMAPDGRTARGSFRPPVTDLELDDFVQRVGLARRRSGSADTRMEAIRELGTELFDALIRDDVGTVFHSARSAAAERDRGLRITLRLSGSPELMRLPWEFLYKRPRFIAQSTQTPIVRALDVDTAMHPQPLRLPLRILAMVSSPSGYPELDAGVERRNLERALAVPRAAGLVEVTWLERATLGELGRRIAEPDEVHVLHYIGHGAYDEATESGILVLETPQGRAHDVTGEEIGAMLQDETSLRLVVLNACEGARSSHVDPFSGVAASLVNFDIPAVIGMQFEITDDAAIAFSESLYTGLARGLPVDAALAPARRAIIGAMLATEFGTPVLFLRDGEARLFEVAEGQADGAVAPPVAPPVAPVVEDLGDLVAEPGRTAGPVPTPEDAVAAPGATRVAEPVVGAGSDGPVAEQERMAGVAAAPPPEGEERPPVGGAAAAAERSRSPVAVPIALAWIAAATLACTALLVVPVWIAWTVEGAIALYLTQTVGAAALAAHHATRPNRDWVAAALYAAVAGASAFSLSNADGDWALVMWGDVIAGAALIAVGVRLWALGTRRDAPFARSARIPAPFAVFAGAMYVLAAIVWFNSAWDWEPFASQTWAFALLGLAAGYVVSALLLAREAASPQVGRPRARPATGSDRRVAAAVALAVFGAVLLAYGAWMVVASALRPADVAQLTPAAILAQTVALLTLAAHHLSRVEREGWPAAAGYGIAAVAAVYVLSYFPTDAALGGRGVPVIGLALVAVGGWLAVAGRRGRSPFAPSLRTPAPFVIAVGATYLIASVVWLNSLSAWVPLVDWLLPLALLAMAAGYVMSGVLLARAARSGTRE